MVDSRIQNFSVPKLSNTFSRYFLSYAVSFVFNGEDDERGTAAVAVWEATGVFKGDSDVGAPEDGWLCWSSPSASLISLLSLLLKMSVFSSTFL